MNSHGAGTPACLPCSCTHPEPRTQSPAIKHITPLTMRNPLQLSDSVTVTQETYGKAGDFCSLKFKPLPQDRASRPQLGVQGTGSPCQLHHLQHLQAELHHQQKLGGWFPSRISSGACSNDDVQDSGRLTASFQRHIKVEKKPQKSEAPDLQEMWLHLNAEVN